MTDKENYPNQLKRIIDAMSLAYVLDHLHLICCNEAEHIRKLGLNENRAKSWEHDATQIAQLKIEN